MQIRKYQPDDADAVVELSVRAWAPVFTSIEALLGQEIFVRLHGDWHEFQANAVRSVLDDRDVEVWVAEADNMAGFVATKIADPLRLIGEVWMLAVDPIYQNHGIASALLVFATDHLSEVGMRVAMIATGGDVGHAPARRVYEKADYTLLPTAQYWRSL